MSWSGGQAAYDFGEDPQPSGGNYGGGSGGGDSYGGYSAGGGGQDNYGYQDTNYPHYMTPDFSNQDGNQQQPAVPGLDNNDFENEPPLLEELGIHPEHIIQKTLSVLNPMRKTSSDVAGDADLAGPLTFCLAFGALLLLSGKVHFNYIYGIGGLGCATIYALLRLMNVRTDVSATVVVSTLGYCILPIVGLSGLGVLVTLNGLVGTLLAFLAVGWCSLSASKLFVTAFDMDHQQLLVAYPCSLLYGLFALITVF